MKKVLLIASLLVSMNVWAIPLTTLLNGGSITAGDKLFDQWELFLDDSEFGVNTDLIEVIALNDGGLDPGPGLHFEVFGDTLSVDGNGFYNYLDFQFGFRVEVLDPDLMIKDNSLAITGASLTDVGDLASVFINEFVHADLARTQEIGFKEVEFSRVGGVPTDNLTDSAVFNPVKELWVTKNILLEAGDFGERATLISFEQRFSQTSIPEPGSLVLLSLGLLGVFARKNQV